MTALLLYISLFMIAYIYIGYPLAVMLLGAVLRRQIQASAITPTVSVIIAAYNEEEHIRHTIANKLAQEYPDNLLEVIVVSDGSTDRTDQIVCEFPTNRVKLIRQNPRAGKTSGLNLAIPLAKGEIIVFSDANSIYAPDAIQRLVANFADSQVGYVSGKMIYANPDGTTIGKGCGAYMRYENALRAAESRIGSIVGVDGGIDAMRKSLYRPMNADQLPDFVQPLKVVEQGYRVVYEPSALLWESSLKDAGDEYRMRVRVSLRAFWALYDMRRLLSPFFNPLFAFQLWSHKVLRYLCFIFLALAFATNLLLLSDGVGYLVLFILQCCGYLAALIMPFMEKIGKGNALLSFPRYFLLLNIAAAHAFGKFLRGEKQVIWTPRKG